jgi:hypothetical protein
MGWITTSDGSIYVEGDESDLNINSMLPAENPAPEIQGSDLPLEEVVFNNKGKTFKGTLLEFYVSEDMLSGITTIKVKLKT